MKNLSSFVTPEKELSLEEREAILANYPLFCLLTPKDIHHLALISNSLSISESTIVVTENTIIDAVYIIVTGNAKVTKTIATVEKTQIMHIADLYPGDAIGLSDSGFFSHKGLRTATVTSTSAMNLLMIELSKLYEFLQQPEMVYPQLKNVGEIFLLMNFIQNTHLFNHFELEEIQRLSKKINKIVVDKGAYICREGEQAREFYFILYGEVEIFTTIDGKEKQLKVLGHSNIFGEAAFLDGSTRNASVRALTKCELFVLTQDVMEKFSPTNKEKILLSSKETSIRISQLHPIHKRGITMTKEFTADGETVYLLQNPKTHDTFILSSVDHILWNEFDGVTTLDAILAKKIPELANLTLNKLYDHVLNFVKSGFLQITSDHTFKEYQSTSLFERFINTITSLLNIKDKK